jgi:hypothetical protein
MKNPIVVAIPISFRMPSHPSSRIALCAASSTTSKGKDSVWVIVSRTNFVTIDVQKINWKFRTSVHEHTGVSLQVH